MAAHRYWRILIIANHGASYSTVCELEMFDVLGGTNLCTGGTPISSSNYDATWTAAKAFDGIKNTDSGWATLNSQHIPSYIGYDFGSGNDKDIIQFAITARQASLNETPKTFFLEWSDDGVVWNMAHGVYDVAVWTSNLTRTYNVAAWTPKLEYPWDTERSVSRVNAPYIAKPYFFTGGGGSFSGTTRTNAGAVSYSTIRAFDTDTGLLAGETQANVIGEWSLQKLKGGKEYFIVATHPSNTWEQMISSQRFPQQTDIQMRSRIPVGEAISVLDLIFTKWAVNGSYVADVNSASWTAHTLRQVFPVPTTKGNKIKFTLRAGSNTCTVNQLYVGYLTGTYNYADTPVALTVGGNTSFTITANTEVVTDPIDFNANTDSNLMVSAYLTGGDVGAKATVAGWQAYQKAGDTADDLTASGYSTIQNGALVNKVEIGYNG